MKEINEVLEEIKYENSLIKKKNKKFIIHTVIYLVLICILLSAVTYLTYKNQTSNLKANKRMKMARSAKIFEEQSLGNSNRNTLQAGRFLDMNNNLYVSYNGYIYKGQSEFATIDASYLNAYKNGILCRDNENASIAYVKNDGQIIRDRSEVKVGELLVVKDDIYYINLNNGYLYKENLKDTNTTQIYKNCKKFAIINSLLFLVTNSNTLCKIDLTTNKVINHINNVMDFTLDNKYIYVFNGQSIYKYEWTFDKVSQVIKKASYLIGIVSQGIVYALDQNVYINKEKISSDIDYCQACYEGKDNYDLLMRSINANSSESIISVAK